MATMMTTMMTGLLLLLLAGVTVSRVVDLDKRVYNGVPCGENDHRYHVRLVSVNERGIEFWSGASLISPQWILTAAHNVEPGEKVTATLGFHPGTKVKEVKITEDPIRYRDPDGSGPHDLMLLKLSDADHGYLPAPLTDCINAPKITDTVQIAGIGATGGGNLETSLQCGNTKVVQCKEIPKCYNQNEKHLCYHDTVVDASKGDSGGGVEFKGMIYGVTIRGGKDPCKVPVRAINICDPEYKRWINKYTGIGIL